MSEDENYWQAKYERLNLSLAKNKRLFSDEYSQSVIESQVKRIKRLEDDLSFARCELDKERKKNAAMIGALVIARDEFYRLNGAGTCPLEIEDILGKLRKETK